MASKKFIYLFGGGKADGRAEMKDLLGGKGANLAEMTNIGAPVPPGFTISTEACRYYDKNGHKFPPTLEAEIDKSLKKLQRQTGKEFGSTTNPLLLSVRSGAKFSMPGMMDTILNLGLNDDTVKVLLEKTGNTRFAHDTYRRFISMFGDVVLGIEKKEFEDILQRFKKRLGVKDDTELTADTLKDIVEEYKTLVKEKTGKHFPQDPRRQLLMAIEAVFKSWNNPRAVTYRNIYRIPHDIGTAVNVQVMVFGNTGENSATGVGFTRDPGTGENRFYGEYLTNAQGEDVVAGIRTPKPISDLEKQMPEVYKKLSKITSRLEKHYRDIQDFEFTVEDGKLYMLQTRVGKRTGLAAIKIAMDMVAEKLISKEEAIMRVEPDALAQYLFPIFDPKEEGRLKPLAKGLPAGPGAASGKVVLTANRAVEQASRGGKVVLVRTETSADDIHGMKASQGFLTTTGGMTSHAAVVARQMGKVCVAGAGDVQVDERNKTVKIGKVTIKEGDSIAINGFTGAVYALDIPREVPSEVIQVLHGKKRPEESHAFRYFSAFLKWTDEFRRLRVRANADTPEQAREAVELGGEGIGLCRTEHMFFAKDRVPIMQKMIMAETQEEREKYLALLLPMQKDDFLGLFKEMDGLPVTIRLLDPPLHEFLPKKESLLLEIDRLERAGENSRDILNEKRRVLRRVEELHEFNPMLGLRGCRLGILMPEISRMQTKAIIEAAIQASQEGTKVIPEIMVPLVGMASEMRAQKELIAAVLDEVMKKSKKKIPCSIGTMIELPRAAITADEIAKEAEFFSFGTNDLTQTTYGFSRDDTGRIIQNYISESRIIREDPFATLDETGVGFLMKIGVEKGRAVRKDLKVGICGEHGGDPASVEFCHRVGLNYVSCAPKRIPIARLAAARAAIREKEQKKAKKS